MYAPKTSLYFYNMLSVQILFVLTVLSATINGSLVEWFWTTNSVEHSNYLDSPSSVTPVKVPFEVKAEDEKFLEQAEKYTSLKLSDLDSCQHQVVMKIRSSCSLITEEDLAKMSVNLLNCQSAIEGRQQFPCTERMTLRECTSAMDSDMWNTYHLMNNRARAVCYAARQQQFRALSEMTVNRLMSTAQDQLTFMNTLQEGQQKLESVTKGTLESVSAGHASLHKQQEQLYSTQQRLQDFVGLNLRELTREKALIAAGQRELARMTEEVQRKLDSASAELSSQAVKRRSNHKELLADLNAIHKQASLIWERIERSTEEILARHLAAASQYELTLEKLSRINSTVHYLLGLMERMRSELDLQLGWITSFVGGTDDRLDRLYISLQHAVYLLTGMVVASFVGLPTVSRALLLVVVPLNLAVVLHHGPHTALDFPSITTLIVASFSVRWLVWTSYCWLQPLQQQPVPFLRSNQQGFANTPAGNHVPSAQHKESWLGWTSRAWSWCKLVTKSRWNQGRSAGPHTTGVPAESKMDESSDSEADSVSSKVSSLAASGVSFRSPPTPSRTPSRSGTPRPACRAICRSGHPCRNTSAPGDDFCRIHGFSSSFASSS